MIVAELIAKLQEMPQDAVVYVPPINADGFADDECETTDIELATRDGGSVVIVS